MALVVAGCNVTHHVNPYVPDSGAEGGAGDGGLDAGMAGGGDDTDDGHAVEPAAGGFDGGADGGGFEGPDAALDDDDAVDEDAGVDPEVVDPPCEEQLAYALDGLPDDLACTGLYADMRTKVIADGMRHYAPAVPLWSDGSGKMRWLYLPEGEKIDVSNPNEWVFPVGTKAFKEFRVDGRRVETRIFQKIREDRWSRATYRWNRQETRARRFFGGDLEEIQIAGLPYHIPSGGECDQCHGGREDRLLGVEAISLSLPGAQGVTLQGLIDEERLSPAPLRSRASIGDDGTGVAGEVLTWMHINCGVCCHNDNPNADAYPSGLFLKLDVSELDGRPVTNFEPWRLMVDVEAKNKRWGDRKRIVPGNARDSLVYQLITSRAGPKEQMPPIASKVIDVDHTELVRQWIESL